jgi:hypothetical protein
MSGRCRRRSSGEPAGGVPPSVSRALRSAPRHTLNYLMLATVGCSLGIPLLSVRATATPESRAFVASPRFAVWASVLLVQMAAWPIIHELARHQVQRMREGPFEEESRHESMSILNTGYGVLGLIILAGSVALTTQTESPMYLHNLRMSLVVLFAIVAARPAAIGIWLVHGVLSRITITTPEQAHDTVSKLVELRRYLQRFLLTLSTMVGAGTLATGGLRRRGFQLPG